VSRDNFHRKSGAAIPLGGEWGLAAVLFEQSAHLLDASPVRKAFPAFAGTSLGQTRGSTFPAFAGTGCYFLNQSRPVPPEGLFISLQFEDTGDGIVIAFLLPFPPGDVAVVITHHLLAPVRDVRTHRGQPFEGGKDFGRLAVLGRIDDLPLLIQVLHPLLGEGRPNDVTRQIFHGRIVIRRNPVSAEDVEAGMPVRNLFEDIQKICREAR